MVVSYSDCLSDAVMTCSHVLDAEGQTSKIIYKSGFGFCSDVDLLHQQLDN